MKAVMKYVWQFVLVVVLFAVWGCEGPLADEGYHNPYADDENASPEAARLNQRDLYITDTPQIEEAESGDTRLDYSLPSPAYDGAPPPPDEDYP